MATFEEALEELKTKVDVGQEYMAKTDPLALGYVTKVVCPLLRDALLLCHCNIATPEGETGELVVHYTSIDALVSMLRDAATEDKRSSLRLYDSVHLNDPDEGNYFTRHLNLPTRYAHLGQPARSHAYLTSFILPKSGENVADNLILWRTYGHEGAGCSLSLSTPHSRPRKVLYGPKQVKITAKSIAQVLDSIDPLVQRLRHGPRKDISDKLTDTVRQALEGLRYLYKSDHYKDENEWRVVVAESDIHDTDNICFDDQGRRDRFDGLRHYYLHDDLLIKKLLITGSTVTLGPCVPDRYNTGYYLKTLMRRANLHGPKINCSKISYRKS